MDQKTKLWIEKQQTQIKKLEDLGLIKLAELVKEAIEYEKIKDENKN
jgi:hypothetical protein